MAKAVTQIQVWYIEMYPIIWNYLSLESQLQVMDIADWSTIEDSRNVARLITRISETHRTGEVRIAPLALKLAKQRYEACRQSGTETVAEYKKRFDEALSAFVASGGRNIPEDELAIDFMSNLDSRRFAQFSVDLQNGFHNGTRTIPTTLSAMYQLVSTYKVVSSTGQIVTATAYKTAATTQRSPSTSNESTPPKSPSSKGKKTPPSSLSRPCKHCGGDHWDRECPQPKSEPKNTDISVGPTKDTSVGPTKATTRIPFQSANGTVNLTFTPNTLDATGIVLHTHTIEDNAPLETDQVFCMDTQANVSLVNNKDQLSNMRTAPIPMNISGIDSGSKALVSTLIGDFTPLGITAYFQPQAAANVLSGCFYDLNSVCAVVFDSTANQYSVTNPNIGTEFVFIAVSDPSDPSQSYISVALDQLDSLLTGGGTGDRITA